MPWMCFSGFQFAPVWGLLSIFSFYILKERFLIFAASTNFLSAQGGNSVDANLLKENQDLRGRLSVIETKYANSKAEAKIISNENKSLVTALLLKQ